MKFPQLKLRKKSQLPMCGEHRTINELIDYYEFCGVRGEEAPESNVQSRKLPARVEIALDRGDDLFILDVREPHEFQICNLKGHLIPLGELPRAVHELDSSRESWRTAAAANAPRKPWTSCAAGFRKTASLKGGILAWSDEVDPSSRNTENIVCRGEL